jgi:hypothetical protein
MPKALIGDTAGKLYASSTLRFSESLMTRGVEELSSHYGSYNLIVVSTSLRRCVHARTVTVASADVRLPNGVVEGRD